MKDVLLKQKFCRAAFDFIFLFVLRYLSRKNWATKSSLVVLCHVRFSLSSERAGWQQTLFSADNIFGFINFSIFLHQVFRRRKKEEESFINKICLSTCRLDLCIKNKRRIYVRRRKLFSCSFDGDSKFLLCSGQNKEKCRFGFLFFPDTCHCFCTKLREKP